MIGIIITIAIVELIYHGLSLTERIRNWFAIGNLVISVILSSSVQK